MCGRPPQCCVAGDTLVRVSERGLVAIKNVRPGDRIVTIAGREFVDTPVVEVAVSFDLREFVLLQTDIGAELVITPNEEVFSGGGWVRVDALKRGDELTWPISFPTISGSGRVLSGALLVGTACDFLPCKVSSARPEPNRQRAYSMKLADHHSFLAAGIVVRAVTPE